MAEAPLGAFAGAAGERACAPIDHSFGDARVRTQGLRNDVPDAWVIGRGFGNQPRKILSDMSTWGQHEGMSDDGRCALLDASPECVANRWFCKLHVGDLDDAVVWHPGFDQLGNMLDQLVCLIASAAVVDQKNRVPFGHKLHLGLRCSCVKNGRRNER